VDATAQHQGSAHFTSNLDAQARRGGRRRRWSFAAVGGFGEGAGPDPNRRAATEPLA